MRNVILSLVAVGLLAVPSFAVVNVAVQSGGQALVEVLEGTTPVLTVDILAQGDETGLYTLSGDVTASGPAILSTVADSFAWVPSFKIVALPGFIEFTNGVAGANGGWSEFGSAQTTGLTAPDFNYNKDAPDVVASYQVQVLPAARTGDVVVLSFVPGEYGGWAVAENIGAEVGTLSALTIKVVPEPATMALLALGGLLVARRRHA